MERHEILEARPRSEELRGPFAPVDAPSRQAAFKAAWATCQPHEERQHLAAPGRGSNFGAPP
jgi:hypothetical protein